MIKIFFSLLIIANVSLGQTVNYDAMITPPKDSADMGERLVAIAWKNYPTNEVFQRQIYIAQKEVSLAKLNWTQNLRLFYNFNDKVLQNSVGYNRPIYGLGVGISLGDLIMRPASTKLAKEGVKIAEANLNTQKLYIRTEVLKRYYNYLMMIDLLKVRSQSYEDANSSYQIITQQYKNGQATISMVDDAGRLFYKTNEEKMVMETQLILARISLEEILAMKWEEVEAFEKGIQQKKGK